MVMSIGRAFNHCPTTPTPTGDGGQHSGACSAVAAAHQAGRQALQVRNGGDWGKRAPLLQFPLTHSRLQAALLPRRPLPCLCIAKPSRVSTSQQ